MSTNTEAKTLPAKGEEVRTKIGGHLWGVSTGIEVNAVRTSWSKPAEYLPAVVVVRDMRSMDSHDLVALSLFTADGERLTDLIVPGTSTVVGAPSYIVKNYLGDVYIQLPTGEHRERKADDKLHDAIIAAARELIPQAFEPLTPGELKAEGIIALEHAGGHLDEAWRTFRQYDNFVTRDEAKAALLRGAQKRIENVL